MPRIPVYDSQGSVKPVLPSPIMNEASGRMKPFTDLQSDVTGVLQTISDAKDKMDSTEAISNFEVGALDIYTRGQADPDFRNSKKYDDELNDLAKSSVSNISNQMVAQEVSAEINHRKNITAIKLGSGFEAKRVDYTLDKLNDGLEAITSKKVFAWENASPDELKEYDRQRDALINQNLALLGQAGLEETRKSVTEYEATNLAQYFPKKFLEVKDQYDIDQVKMKDLEKIASGSVEKLDLEVKRVKKETQIQNSIALLNGISKQILLPVSEVNNLIKDEIIPYEVGSAYIRAINTAITEEDIESDTTGYLELFTQILEDNKPEAVMTHTTNVLNGGADGRFNQKELDSLVQVLLMNYDKQKKNDSSLKNTFNSIMQHFLREDDADVSD